MSQRAVSPLQAATLQNVRLAERELHDRISRIGMTGSGEDAAPADVEFSSECTLPAASTTPRFGSSLMRVVPMW